jgi:hypothetical protein
MRHLSPPPPPTPPPPPAAAAAAAEPAPGLCSRPCSLSLSGALLLRCSLSLSLCCCWPLPLPLPLPLLLSAPLSLSLSLPLLLLRLLLLLLLLLRLLSPPALRYSLLCRACTILRTKEGVLLPRNWCRSASRRLPESSEEASSRGSSRHSTYPVRVVGSESTLQGERRE